jgi:hypothetical protein
MKIRDITISDILARKKWRLTEPDLLQCLDLPMEEWGPIGEAEKFLPSDHVVYSGIAVYASGRVTPIVCVREVQYLDYGGDYCEFVDGAWRQLGLVPDPNADVGKEYIADPLPYDPSFEAPDHDYRQYHRDGFARHARRLRQ